jgi:hypothetical protein
MNTNDLTIFFLAMTAGASALVFFSFACHALINILKTADPIRTLPTNTNRDRAATLLAERRKLETIPTVTCAMPITVQVRVEGRLW